jgi:hypothetical protein
MVTREARSAFPSMAAQGRGYSIVPAVLGAGLLALLVAAGLSPNTGAISASTNCGIYNNCPSSSPAFPWWIVAVVVLLVVAALIAALVLMRRRRPPAAGAPVQPWQGAPATPPAGGAPPGATSPSYLETPEDVGTALPDAGLIAAGAAGAGAAAGAAASEDAAEGEPDIDSLMAELDKISGEILKRPAKKSPDEENAGGSGDQGTQ